MLVQFERAGTKLLSDRIKIQIDELLQKRLILKERVDIKKTLSVEDQTTYYSSWHFAAVHMLTTIGKYQIKESIENYLNISYSRLTQVLEFLISVGLVTHTGGRYKPGVSRLFLGSDSPMISRHHTNWRMRAIESLDHDFKNDLHLSSVVTINHDDALKIKKQLVQNIEDARARIRDSNDEDELHCFCLDFFQVR